MKKYVAELVGTFVLVFGGVGSAVLAGTHIGNLGVALAFGLSLLAMAYAIGPISGCHINPAVTLGILIARKIGNKDAAMYMVAQIIGAIIAAGVILLVASGVGGIKGGRTVKFPSKTPLTNLLLTMLDKAGVPDVQKLGDSTKLLAL